MLTSYYVILSWGRYIPHLEQCVDVEDMIDGSLFITTLDENKYVLELEISTLEDGKTTGSTSEFIEKNWSITHKEVNLIIKSNTQLNYQLNNCLLSRHFSPNDCMI